MNSAVYPEEVEHLSDLYGSPQRLQVQVETDPEFQRAFRASLRRRRAEVAFIIVRAEGRILVTTKTFYPKGVFRIPTGGVKPGEAVEEAMWRELAEETGLTPSEKPRFAAVIEYRMEGARDAVRFATYLFVVNAAEGEPHCSDPDEEICEYQELAPEDLRTLAHSLSNLGPSWRSWGVWRAVPHNIAATILTGEAPENAVHETEPPSET